MKNPYYLRKIILLIGDVLILYVSFFVSLIIRYGSIPSLKILNIHKVPISTLYLIWILVFFIAGFYEVRKFFSFNDLKDQILKTMAVVGVISVLIFYIIPFWNITPKTILVINIFVATLAIYFWRKFYFLNVVKSSKTNVVFFGSTKEMIDFKDFINDRPQLSYNVVDVISEDSNLDLKKYVKDHNIDIVVISDDIKHDDNMVNIFYEIIPLGVSVADFSIFYESLMEKIPLFLVNKAWFLKNVAYSHKLYESSKRPVEFIFALVLILVLSPLFLLVPFLIRITSEGDPLFKQVRVGKNGKNFNLYKFRTMKINNESPSGDKWLIENDPRITSFGKILRLTRVDEIPQLWNIIKGDMSFIGPRPDFIDFYTVLDKTIPYYKIRTLVTPGLTGWAQIHNKFGGSPEEAKDRLAYEIFYLKNLSISLDLSIALKTIKTVLSSKGR